MKKRVTLSDITLSDIVTPQVVDEPVMPAPSASPEISDARRASRSHTTIYLDRRVLLEVRKIAVDYDRKPHDLPIEAVNMMLAKYGRPSVDALSKE